MHTGSQLKNGFAFFNTRRVIMISMPIGIDIAKSVFQIHYVDADTGEIVNKALKRAVFLEYLLRPIWLTGKRKRDGTL